MIQPSFILATEMNFFDRVKTVNKDGNNIYHLLALEGKSEQCKALNVYGVGEGRLWSTHTAALQARNNKGELLTHIVTRSGNLEFLEELYAKGMSLFDKDQSNNTLAHIAAVNDRTEILSYLWEKRFAEGLNDPQQGTEHPIFDAVNDDGLTPYALACKFKKEAAAEYMKSRTQDFTYECKFIKAIYDGSLEEAEKATEAKPELISNLTIHALADLPKHVRRMVMLNCVSRTGALLPFHVLAFSKKVELVEFLTSIGVELNVVNKHGENALQFLARCFAFESEPLSESVPEKPTNQFAFSLMQQGLNIKRSNKRSENILHYAARSGNGWLLEAALNRGVFIDQITELGLTPLHYGVYYQKKEIVEILIKNKANQNLLSFENASQALFEVPQTKPNELSPLCLALERKNFELVELLMVSTPKRVKSTSGKTALHVAAIHGDIEKFKQFQEKYKLNYLETDADGYNPLHFASQFGRIEIVKYIVIECRSKTSPKNVFNIDQMTNDKSSALMLAQTFGHHQVAIFLKEQGATLEVAPEATGLRAVSETLVKAGESWMKQRAELMQTKTYKLLSIGSIGFHTLKAYPLGPHAMFGVGLYHSANYFAPSLPGGFSKVYNQFRTSGHNNLPSYLNNGFKYSAKGGDALVKYSFTALNVLDWVSDPVRRVAGVVGGEIASRLPEMMEIESKEVKAAALFFGQEFTMMALNSYRQYGDMNEDQFTYSSDAKYEHAFTIWASILGRENGELVADFGQYLEDLSEEISLVVGKGVSKQIEGIQQRRPSIWLSNTAQILSSTATETLSYLNISAGNKLYVNPTEIMEYVRYKNHEISELRGKLISELETSILNLMPESDYKNHALSHWAATQAVQVEQQIEELKHQKNILEVEGDEVGECIAKKSEALHDLGKHKSRDEVDYDSSKELRSDLERLLQSQKERAKKIDVLSKAISEYDRISNQYHQQAESRYKLTSKYRSRTHFTEQDEQYFTLRKSHSTLLEEEQEISEALNVAEQRLGLVLNPLPVDPHLVTKKAYDIYGEGEDRAGDIADHIGNEFVDAGYFSADQKQSVFLNSVKASLKGKDKFKSQAKKTAETLKNLLDPESRNANAAPIRSEISDLRARLNLLERNRVEIESSMSVIASSREESRLEYINTLSRYSQEGFNKERKLLESTRNDELVLDKLFQARQSQIKMADHQYIVDEAIENGIGYNGRWLKEKIASHIVEQLLNYKYSVLPRPDAESFEAESKFLKQKFIDVQVGFRKETTNFLVKDRVSLTSLFESERVRMMHEIGSKLIEVVEQALPCNDESETCSQTLKENVFARIEEIYFPKNEFLKDDRNFIKTEKERLLEAKDSKISVNAVVKLLEASTRELKHQNTIAVQSAPTVAQRAQSFLQVSTPHKGGHEYRDLVAEATISEILPPGMDDEFRKLTKQFVANAINGRESLRQKRLERAIHRILDFFAIRPLYEEYKTGRIPDARIRSDLFEIDPIHARAAFLAYACNDKRLEYGLVGMPDYQLFSFYDRFLSAQSTTQHSKEKRRMRRVVKDSFKGVGDGWSPSKGELKSIQGYMKDHSAKFSGFEWNSVAPEYYRIVHVYGNDFGRRAASWITKHAGGAQGSTNWDLNDSNRHVEVKFQKATSGYEFGKSKPSQFTLDLSHLSRSTGSGVHNTPASNMNKSDGVYQAKSIEDYAPSLKKEKLTTGIPIRETTVPYRLPDTYAFSESENGPAEKVSAFWSQYLEHAPPFPVLEQELPSEGTSKAYTLADHAKLAYKAMKGERGEDVQAWQSRNREVTPKLASMVDGVRSKAIPPSEVVTSFVEGVAEGIVETATFIGEEVVRVYRDEPTITGETGRKIARFAESEIEIASHGEKTETEKAIKRVSAFLGEDYERIRNGEESEIASGIMRYVDETPTQDILRGFGNEVGLGGATGTIVNAGGKALTKATSQVGSLVREYEFRTPYKFQYSASQLNSGLPLDKLDFRNPMVKKSFEGSPKDHAKAISDAQRHTIMLYFQEQGILTTDGRLSEYAIDNSKPLLREGTFLKNPEVVQLLTKDGSRIEDWQKRTTPAIDLPNGQKRQIHFYRNEQTGEVNYDHQDYKVKDRTQPVYGRATSIDSEPVEAYPRDLNKSTLKQKR
ncbi:MAG: ankyrin repeat domain-containing protein [Gammaproteobacteria bacterium]